MGKHFWMSFCERSLLGICTRRSSFEKKETGREESCCPSSGKVFPVANQSDNWSASMEKQVTVPWGGGGGGYRERLQHCLFHMREDIYTQPVYFSFSELFNWVLIWPQYQVSSMLSPKALWQKSQWTFHSTQVAGYLCQHGPPFKSHMHLQLQWKQPLVHTQEERFYRFQWLIPKFGDRLEAGWRLLIFKAVLDHGSFSDPCQLHREGNKTKKALWHHKSIALAFTSIGNSKEKMVAN